MYSINILLQLLEDLVLRHLGTIISMSRRVLATLGRLYKRIFKSLMTQPRIYVPIIMKYVFIYINMFNYIHKALLLPTSMNPVNCA